MLSKLAAYIHPPTPVQSGQRYRVTGLLSQHLSRTERIEYMLSMPSMSLTRFTFKLIALVLFSLPSFSRADEIAITFDDLPGQQDESAENQRVINERILKALKKFNAPATGFVNEGKLYSKGQTNEKISILKLWVDDRHPLGNHTYSHKSLSSSKANEFQNDVIKGAQVSKKLMADSNMPYRYFRHPYLDTGTTKEIRDSLEFFLKKENYIVAPVTVDTDDWKFDFQLREHPNDKEKILAKYLEHTKVKFAFYKAAAEKMFGRNIRHTWILHVNALNSYAMDDLLKIVTDLGYKIVSLDQALQDKAYSEPDNYYASFGNSWLYRWDYTRGKVVDWSQDPEPDNNPFIEETALKYFDPSRSRSIPVQVYVSGESEGKAKAGITKLPIVIINHGYGAKNTEYSFIAKSLAACGYFVVSIQHDLDTDEPLPRTGDLFERRKPLWERGTQNILFTLDQFKKENSHLDFTKIILIGHSNGGDISMMFTDRYPEKVSKVVSLDSLRYPFPSSKGVPILHFSATDTTADVNVIPDKGVKTVLIQDVKHIDLCDQGGIRINEEILQSIIQFLAPPERNPGVKSIKPVETSSLQDKLAKLETLSGGRIGLSAIDTANNRRFQYRAEERFPMCSTFKVMAVGAALNRAMNDAHFLQKKITYSKADITASGYAPITEKNLAGGMPVSDLCAAAIQYSDNAAVNLFMKELGGLEAVTAFARSIGDDIFRLDRWEPELNSATPGDLRDTSTPAATQRSLQRLLFGDALAAPQREQLKAWLKGNTTGDTRIRAGVPKDWVVGDKTGTCGSYGTTNDIGIIWPEKGAPIILAIYFIHKDKDAPPRNEVIASVTQLLISAFADSL